MTSLSEHKILAQDEQREFMFQITRYTEPNLIRENEGGSIEIAVEPFLAEDLDPDNMNDESIKQFKMAKMKKQALWNDTILDKINSVQHFLQTVRFDEYTKKGLAVKNIVQGKAKKAKKFWESLIELDKTEQVEQFTKMFDGSRKKYYIRDWKKNDGENGTKNMVTATTDKGYKEFSRAVLMNVMNNPDIQNEMMNLNDRTEQKTMKEMQVMQLKKKEKDLKKSEKNKAKKEKAKAKKAAKAAEKAAKKAAKEEEKKLIAEQNRIKREEAAFRKAKQEAEKQAKQEAEKQARIAKKKMKKQMKKQAKAATKIQAIARGMNERSPPPSPTPQQDFKNLLQRTGRDLRKYKNMKAGKTRRKKKQRKRRKSKRRTRNKRGGLLLFGAYAAYKFLTKKNKKKRRKKTRKR